jgi:hypothetical protein
VRWNEPSDDAATDMGSKQARLTTKMPAKIAE